MSADGFESFRGKTVLVTGHTGFKGSWLTIWLQELGANVVGYSLEPPTKPSLFSLSRLEETMTHVIGDVRDAEKLNHTIDHEKPEVIFHLAAQPIILHSFTHPHETFSINAGGTVNLLDAARNKAFVKSLVIVTTDKCYVNNEWVWGYRENDPLGGDDPYSASKAMAELAVAAYRTSFFKQGTAIATARAGNVIGGGDFSPFRLLPDCMKALMKQVPIEVRHPSSVRPWLHVLDPLYGYLMLANRLLREGRPWAEAWNFGPLEHEAVTTRALVENAIGLWGHGEWIDIGKTGESQENTVLKLNWDKAANRLRWHPAYTWKEALAATVDWFKAYEQSNDMRRVCVNQVRDYTKRRSA
ncbi:MAG: CDP-glucose 4,6-dehydratase [Waddliaceae bacterium]